MRKSVDLFCASPASTAICSSMDQRSMVRRGMTQTHERHRLGGGRPDRKPRTPIVVPCSSHIPISPRPYFEKTKLPPPRRKSSADVIDLSTPRSSAIYLLSENPMFEQSENSSSALVPPSQVLPLKIKNLKNHEDFPVFRSSSARESPVYHSRPSFSRSNNESPLSLPYSTQSNAKKSLPISTIGSQALKSLSIYKQDHPRDDKSSTTRSLEQVVELRVSIHCKGCEGKIRKHISRMEGVTSFSTDLATKKVTVVGNVTPLSVLTSISKVKYAEFWESPTSSSSSSLTSSSS